MWIQRVLFLGLIFAILGVLALGRQVERGEWVKSASTSTPIRENANPREDAPIAVRQPASVPALDPSIEPVSE